MTLSIATPSIDPITTLSNGIKIIRCAEYIGAARGSLSVVSDPLSVAGEVVKDEQALAIATTTATRWSSVADSVTIPYADLNYQTDQTFSGYLGLRCEGSTPISAKQGEKWNYYFNNIGPTVETGKDGTLGLFNTRVPTSIYENYSLLSLGGFGLTFDSGKTNFNIRAWGITNASDPMAWYLDVIYLIPTELKNTDDSDNEFYSAFSYWLGQPQYDPTAIPTDEVPIDIGRYSLLYNLVDGVFSNGCGMELQEGDAENTEFDWNGIFFDDPPQEKSYISIIGVGSRLIKPHTIESIDFSNTTGTPVTQYETPKGYMLSGNSWAAVSGVFRHTGPSGAVGFNAQYDWALGVGTARAVFSSSDPRTYAPQMGHMESFILTMKCNLESGYPTGANVRFTAGYSRLTTGGIQHNVVGVEIEHKTDGTNTARLAARYETANLLAVTMESAGPTTVLGGLAAGGSYWIKVEKRYYHWRAKVWLDGDPEPSSWLLEAHEAAIYSTPGYVQYPWETGWPSSSAPSGETPIVIPTGNSPGFQVATPAGVMEYLSGFNKVSPRYNFSFDNVTVEYDPDSDGSGSYTGAYYHLEKYDGSEDWGTAYIPPGALQVIYTDYAPHHFGGNLVDGTDLHGGNFAAWKESGAKLLQAAVYSQFKFRRKVQNPATFNKTVALR